HGVPFRFPSSPDTGPGLTEAGKDLVRACDERRILIDLSHITEKGFWDVARHSTSPLIATHSNAHGLSASSRNLTDDQLRAIGERGGMAGLNFANGFLRADGRWESENRLDTMLRHLDRMMRLAGEDHVGLGSDFDGARIPSQIGDAAGLPNLVAAMAGHGYGEALLQKLSWDNWVNALERVWGE
ncbi:MAG: peptidase, partial [Alphaproteobacteria bacterium]|nr:peptidase [Alphaproteobacteria bacterium]